MTPILSVRDLSISYRTPRGRLLAVNKVSFDLHRGETLAMIGESGCGKSTLNLGIMRLLPSNARIDGGQILYNYAAGAQIDVATLPPRRLRAFRWRECAMVFQAALNSLNPVIHISDMFYDTAAAHGERNRAEVRKRALDLLEKVRLDADRVFNAYPHELSGGMRQRVLIALALLLDPQVVLMDEPTTALDILTQRNILDVLNQIKAELGFSVIFISHDLSIAAEIADTVATMYAGEIIEMGPVNEIFYQSQHAYTLGLMQASPRLSSGREDLVSIPGSPPDLIEPPTGCKFHPRCPFATQRCIDVHPALVNSLHRTNLPTAGDASATRFTPHKVACHESEQVLMESLKYHARTPDRA